MQPKPSLDARQGSTRAPQWTGGGVVFAPKPRDYSMKMNKKEKALAIKSALTTASLVITRVSYFKMSYTLMPFDNVVLTSGIFLAERITFSSFLSSTTQDPD